MKKRQGELSKAGVLGTHKPGSDPGSATLSWRNIFNTKPQFLHLCNGCNSSFASQGYCDH